MRHMISVNLIPASFKMFFILLVPLLGLAYFTNEVVVGSWGFSYFNALYYPAIGVFGLFFALSLISNVMNDFLYGGDQEYEAWRAMGRDGWVDVLFDPPDPTELPCDDCGHILPADWSLACPNCGFAGEGNPRWKFKCRKCGVRVPTKKGCWNCVS